MKGGERGGEATAAQEVVATAAQRVVAKAARKLLCQGGNVSAQGWYQELLPIVETVVRGAGSLP